MKLCKLGKTKIEVPRIGFGAMPLSTQGRPDEKTALQVLHTAVDKGIRFIDTADVYCLDDGDIGHNERLIAHFLEERTDRDEIYVATKGGLIRPGGAWIRHGKAEHLKAACEKSLQSLGCEQIFLYQFHAPDPVVALEDSLQALLDLQSEGKIRHIGLSNVSLSQIQQAQQIATIESVQNRCHLFYQEDVENGVLDYCQEQGITYIPYSPLGGSFAHQKLSQNPQLLEIAQESGLDSYQAMLAWVLSLGEHVLPIPAARKLGSIESTVAMLSKEIEPAILDRLQGLRIDV